MTWLVTKHIIGKNFEIVESYTEEFDYDESNKAYELKAIWEKEPNTEVFVALV